MKALFVSNDPRIFIDASDVRARLRAYAKELGELHVISRAPFGTEKIEEDGLTLYPFLGGRLGAQLSLPRTVHALIEEHSIDIVSAQDPFEHGRVAMKAVAGTKAKLHLQIHTDFLSPWFTKGGGFRSIQLDMPMLNTMRVRLADTVIPHADGIRVVSERIKQSLTKRYTTIPEPSVIPITVPATLPPAVPLPPHPFSFALMTIGRLEVEKRIEDILMALGRIHRDYPAVGLFVVGDGRERNKLERLTEKLGLTKNVIFTGWRDDTLGLLQSAHAYIQASAYEGYGRTLVEAALARVPIITTDVGIVGEVFTGYTDLLSAPVADPAALAVHIRGLVDDHQARLTFAMNAEHTARNHIAATLMQPHQVAEDLLNTVARTS